MIGSRMKSMTRIIRTIYPPFLKEQTRDNKHLARSNMGLLAHAYTCDSQHIALPNVGMSAARPRINMKGLLDMEMVVLVGSLSCLCLALGCSAHQKTDVERS